MHQNRVCTVAHADINAAVLTSSGNNLSTHNFSRSLHQAVHNPQVVIDPQQRQEAYAPCNNEVDVINSSPIGQSRPAGVYQHRRVLLALHGRQDRNLLVNLVGSRLVHDLDGKGAIHEEASIVMVDKLKSPASKHNYSGEEP